MGATNVLFCPQPLWRPFVAITNLMLHSLLQCTHIHEDLWIFCSNPLKIVKIMAWSKLSSYISIYPIAKYFPPHTMKLSRFLQNKGESAGVEQPKTIKGLNQQNR